MKKIMLPIDGSERSKKTIEVVKALYPADSAEISVVTVREDLDTYRSAYELEAARAETERAMDSMLYGLDGYKVERKVLFGRAGEEILNYAQEMDTDIIIMTKSTRSGWSRMIGSVTAHVVKYAKCLVVIAPEN